MMKMGPASRELKEDTVVPFGKKREQVGKREGNRIKELFEENSPL